MRYPDDWIWDHHRIQVILDGDVSRLQVVCPHDDPEHSYLQGRGPTRCGFVERGCCLVREQIKEFGMEAHCTGLMILVGGLIPIEYGWTGVEEEFWFKVAGYPSDGEVRLFRQEMAEDLLGEQDSYLKIPLDLVAMSPLRPWKDLDEEMKQEFRDSLNEHLEAKERKRNGSAAKTD